MGSCRRALTWPPCCGTACKATKRVCFLRGRGDGFPRETANPRNQTDQHKAGSNFHVLSWTVAYLFLFAIGFYFYLFFFVYHFFFNVIALWYFFFCLYFHRETLVQLTIITTLIDYFGRLQ